MSEIIDLKLKAIWNAHNQRYWIDSINFASSWHESATLLSSLERFNDPKKRLKFNSDIIHLKTLPNV